VVSEEALAAIKGMSENQLESCCSRLRESVDLVEKIKSTYEDTRTFAHKITDTKGDIVKMTKAKNNPFSVLDDIKATETNMKYSIKVGAQVHLNVGRWRMKGCVRCKCTQLLLRFADDQSAR
jgi:hypothetical protein